MHPVKGQPPAFTRAYRNSVVYYFLRLREIIISVGYLLMRFVTTWLDALLAKARQCAEVLWRR